MIRAGKPKICWLSAGPYILADTLYLDSTKSPEHGA